MKIIKALATFPIEPRRNWGSPKITFKELFMRQIKSINGLYEESEVITILFKDGSSIRQWHENDCCEHVAVTQIDGNPSKHTGATIFSIEEKVVVLSDTTKELFESYSESATATFYTMKTSAGYLDWRWTGESNGYYSESVDCKLLNKEETNESN